MQNRAIEEARRPRLSTEAQATLRREGTSNIKSQLATRGLLDSSLFPGALGELEKRIGEAAAGAGTMGDVPGMLWQGALGQGQSGSNLIGNVAEMYFLRQLLGNNPQTQSLAPTPTAQLPWSNPWQPIYNPSMYTPGPLMWPGPM